MAGCARCAHLLHDEDGAVDACSVHLVELGLDVDATDLGPVDGEAILHVGRAPSGAGHDDLRSEEIAHRIDDPHPSRRSRVGFIRSSTE